MPTGRQAATRPVNCTQPRRRCCGSSRAGRRRSRAADERKLHLLPPCAHGLAGALNGFYRDCPVIGSDAEGFRLALVDGTRRVLADVLGLLGVVAPEEM